MSNVQDEMVQKVWKCITKPLRRNRLPWGEEEFLTNEKNPISVTALSNGNVEVKINVEKFSKNTATSLKVTHQIQNALRKKFDMNVRFLNHFIIWILSPKRK